MKNRRLMPVIVVLCLATSLYGQTPDGAAKLRVVVKPAKPFSYEQNGQFAGYSVELWRRLAQEAGFEYNIEQVNTVPEVLQKLESKAADVGLGALSITQEREKILDFSHPFFASGLQIMTGAKKSGHSLAVFESLLTVDVFKVVGILLVALFIMSHVLWLAERKQNPESFPERYKRGVFDALWWSVSTLITGGCENIAPIGVAGRLVGVVWMLGGIALTAYITATLASAMTVKNLAGNINGLDDLQGELVGTVSGSAAETFLKNAKFTPQGFPDVEAAVASLAKGEVKVVVYDSPILRNHLATHPTKDLQIVGDLFDQQSYGFALQLASPYRKRINQALLKLQLEGFLDELDKKWFAVTQK